MRSILALLVALATVVAIAPRRACGDLRGDTARVASAVDRSAGSEGAAAGLEYLVKRVGSLELPDGSMPQLFRQTFAEVVPTVQQCRVADAAGKALPVRPLLPMGGMPGALKAEHLALIYGGGGHLKELRGKEVAGALVALEVDGAESAVAWQRCAALGAKGILFLGNDRTGNAPFLNKQMSVPLGLPRLYCDDRETVERLRAGGVASVSVDLRMTFEERRVTNLLAFFPGRAPERAGQGPSLRDGWLILQAPYDGASAVVGDAPGATQALNAAVLLDIARSLAEAPAHRTALLVWTGGDEWNFRGTRTFLDLLNRGSGAREMSHVVAPLEARAAEARRRAQGARAVVVALEHFLEAGRLPDASLPAAARDAIDEELLRAGNSVEEDLQRARLAEAPDLGALKRQKAELVVASNLLANPQATADAAPLARLMEAARAALPRWERDALRRAAEADDTAEWPRIRAALPLQDPLLVLSLALAGDGVGNVGLSARSSYAAGLDVTSRMSAFAQAFRRFAEGDAGYSPESLENRFTLETFFPTPVAFASDAAVARGQPAAAVASLHAARRFVDAPNDTADHLEWRAIEREAATVRGLLLGTRAHPGVLTDPAFYARTDLQPLTADQPVTLFERAVGETLPQLHAPLALIGGEAEIYAHGLGPALAGTRRVDWYLTHADGTITFESVNRVQEAELRMQAFAFDGAGRPTKALLANAQDVRGLASQFSPDPSHPVRAMLFDCRPLELYGLFDPRNLDTLEQLTLLDARRLDQLQLSNYYAQKGAAAVFLPEDPALRWQVLAAKGAIANRMILINASADDPRGAGFATTDRVELGHPAWRTAQDFFALDSRRKADLEKFGISNDVIRDLHDSSQKQFALAQAAEKRRDYPAFLGAADAVWSLQSQEYQNLIDTSNGIIRGVIFLLLGVIPFSYFLERLVIGASQVYRQIGWFALIFACMTAGLWFHPAFRISSAPLMILLAFLILILSSTVVYILWGKFEEEIRRLRGAAGGAVHVASFQRAAVLGAAVRLGLSNMRRRGTRTTLTLITLVLLTFTLLCFTSVRESVQVSPRTLAWPAGVASPPAGILLRQLQWRELPPETVELARTLALSPPIVLAQATDVPSGEAGPVARRFWYASQRAEQSWSLPVTSEQSTTPYMLRGIVGLDPAEAEFQGAAVAEMLPGLTAAAGELPRCWLPEKARDTLNLRPGDTVRLVGRSFTVAGFFSSSQFAQLRALSGDPLAPLDPTGLRTNVNQSSKASSVQSEASYRFLDPLAVAIVPAPVAEELGGTLTSVMFRPASIPAHPDAQGAAQLDAVADSLARRSAFPVYASDGITVRAINAAEASRPQDLSTVLVPMLIAGVIVLNTMLGAVSERTKEIHVYTSVGLSPAHVGMLFLAEAAALGTLGVVFGYIFGQGLATVLSWTHLLPGVDLNYSSMSAIITMGLVLGIVMLSALFPARAATRLAAPSLNRDWKLPRPVGDVLAVDLPFTVNESAARGVCAFLAEFLLGTSQAGTGIFTADNLEGTIQATTQGPVRGLAARIWLAPYDLGVIQIMHLTIHPSEQQGVFEVHIRLDREAGNPSSWRRLNRPFLVEIRRQFLLWRSLPSERVADYVHKSEGLFAAPPPASGGAA